jgi:hypothetical protein
MGSMMTERSKIDVFLDAYRAAFEALDISPIADLSGPRGEPVP